MSHRRLLVAGILLLAAILPMPVLAASKSTVGVAINPAIEELTVNPGQTSVSFPVEVSNDTAKAAVIYVSVNDFTALNESGEVSFYGNNYKPAANPHGLQEWLKPAVSQFSLNPGQSRTIEASINNLNGLAPGGHYGAMIFFVGYPPTSKVAKAEVSNNQVLSTLVFITTNGQGTQSLSLKQSLISSWYLRIPSSLQIVLANTGNTQTTPRGYVTVENNSGTKDYARGILNSQSGLILPSSARLFNVNLNSEGSSLFGGQYKFVVAYRPDSASSFTYYEKSFNVFGVFWIWLAIVALILIAVSLWVVLPLLLKRRANRT